MDFYVNNEDMEELIEDYKNELSMEEPEKLQEQQQKAIMEEISSEEEVGREDDPQNLWKMGSGAKFCGMISLIKQ